ncbi:hypothetical protein [Aestuariivirga sp.]|uniref:hypothetical protein n=1 Tax=Aestuariivirga sp. TaxID=2650926 RepID=UPI0039E6A3FF
MTTPAQGKEHVTAVSGADGRKKFVSQQLGRTGMMLVGRTQDDAMSCAPDLARNVEEAGDAKPVLREADAFIARNGLAAEARRDTGPAPNA